jgi:hypothetical protein
MRSKRSERTLPIGRGQDRAERWRLRWSVRYDASRYLPVIAVTRPSVLSSRPQLLFRLAIDEAFPNSRLKRVVGTPRSSSPSPECSSTPATVPGSEAGIASFETPVRGC